MGLKPISVTQLNDYISRLLTTDPLLTNIRVEGEISNLKYHSTGHVYFSISDDNSKINCFFPSSYVKRLEKKLSDGEKVIINGYINVYKKGGTYTLFVRSIEFKGEGDLAASFQALKDKLEKEGLFDAKYKKVLPRFPKKIGIVTSETGAALQDILKIIKGRNNIVDILIFPSLVQGPDAAGDIARNIYHINREFSDLDLLIVGRGGGSTEDLWPFNEEIVARAVFASDIPIISAVGHEIDFTICDFVADKRAETPTAAAEIAVPNTFEMMDKLQEYKKNLLTQLENKLALNQLKLESLGNDLYNSLELKIINYSHLLEKIKLVLDENNPLSILNKGFTLIEDDFGKSVSSAKDFEYNKSYSAVFKDGRVNFIAVEKSEGEK